jgi:hypothetical protein
VEGWEFETIPIEKHFASCSFIGVSNNCDKNVSSQQCSNELSMYHKKGHEI